MSSPQQPESRPLDLDEQPQNADWLRIMAKRKQQKQQPSGPNAKAKRRKIT